VTGLLLLLTLGAVLFVSVLIGYTAWGLTHPPRRTEAWAVSKGVASDPSELDEPREFESWHVRSRGIELAVWDVAGDLSDDPRAPVVIVTHGWADSRLGGLVRLPVLLPCAARVLLWEQEGHGRTRGISRLGTAEVRDLLAVIERAGGDAPLVLYGWSLGGGVSIAAAAQSAGRITGVIAEAPYRLPLTPARNVLRNSSIPHRLNLPPATWLLGTLFGVGPAWRGFDRAALAARLECPLLVIHGTADDISPVEDGREIAAAAPHGQIVEIAGAGHNDIWAEDRFSAAVRDAMEAFLASCHRGTRAAARD